MLFVDFVGVGVELLQEQHLKVENKIYRVQLE
jgi:hypothetical protein